jgi:hypothetical protein
LSTAAVAGIRQGVRAQLPSLLVIAALAALPSLGGCHGPEDACDALCAVEAAGAGCGPEVATDCKSTCALLTFSGACGDAATPYFDCAEGQTWTCSGGGAPTADGTACDAQFDAFSNACQL